MFSSSNNVHKHVVNLFPRELLNISVRLSLILVFDGEPHRPPPPRRFLFSENV